MPKVIDMCPIMNEITWVCANFNVMQLESHYLACPMIEKFSLKNCYFQWIPWEDWEMGIGKLRFFKSSIGIVYLEIGFIVKNQHMNFYKKQS